jgi:hypothetical protein
MQLPWRAIPELKSLPTVDRERLWQLAAQRPFDLRDPIGTIILVAGLVISSLLCFWLLHSLENILLKLAVVPAYVFVDLQVVIEVKIRRYRMLIQARQPSGG